MNPSLLDLFCGAGGISHGFAQAGFRVVGGVDTDKDAIATFKANHPGVRALTADLAAMAPADLAEALQLAPGSLDCISGGPPCQGFSRNRAFRHRDGSFVDDPRNHLYWHFFAYVDYLRPKVVVMENVPEILIKGDAFFRDAVIERFESMGYWVNASVLNACEYGVPQRRRRAFFLAGREGQGVCFPDPTVRPGPRAGRRTPTSPDFVVQSTLGNGASPTLPFVEELPEGPTVWDAISDLCGLYAPSLSVECSYTTEPRTQYQRDRRHGVSHVSNHYPWPLTERQLGRIRLLGQGEGQAHLPVELQTREGYGSAYRRLQGDAQALTITTWMFHPGSGMFTHPTQDRVITIREAARLQSFQDTFRFYGGYHSQCRQVGNAVAPLVAHAIAQTILPVLGYRPSFWTSDNWAIPCCEKNAMVSSSPARRQSMRKR